jgi:probable rRNA maturation factor
MPSANPSLNLSVQFADARHKAVLPRALLRTWVKAALKHENAPAEITLRFVSEAEAQSLNTDYRHRDYVPNVLTFDYSHSPCAGDVVICATVIEREAAEQGKTLIAHYAHMVIHGVLHAQGFDHQKKREAALMERLEVQLLQSLGFDSPY